MLDFRSHHTIGDGEVKTKNIWNRITGLLLALAMLLALLNLAPLAAHAEQPQQGKVVRVGYVNVPTYEEGGPGEYKTGAGYEYLQKISYFTGWQYEYVYGSFKELYNMLADGEIDLFGNVSYMPERAELFYFSTYPQGNDVYSIYTRPDRSDLLKGDMTQMNGTRIGVTKDSYQEMLLKQWLANNDITAEIVEFDGYASSMAALDTGIVDAIAAAKLANSSYDYAMVIDIGFSEYYFAVSKKRPDLLTELNEAMYQIQNASPNYNALLESKYQQSMVSDTFLSEKEKQWLADNDNTIRLGYLADSLPYSDQDADGNFVGVLSALAGAMQNSFGVTVEATCYPNNTALQNALANGEVDAIGPSYSDYWLAEQSNVIQTNSVITSTPVLFYKTENSEAATKVIAVSDESFLWADVVHILFPESGVLICKTTEECLERVRSGHASCAVVAASQINLVKQLRAAQNLQVAEVAKQIDICLWVAKADPELANIINKGITSASSLLSGAVLAQNSYVEKQYTFWDFVEDNISAIALLTVVIFLTLLLVVAYTLQAAHSVKEANAEITRKQKELEQALEDAEYANSAKTTFLANMSHDIRTPINGIMGMLEMIDKNQNDPDKIRECLGKIKTSSAHLLQLINDVLDLSRLESGQVILEHVPFNLAQVGEDALAVVEGQAKEAGLQTISEHMDGTDIWLIGSPLHFKQIMLNLYTNAMKYNKPGGLLYTNLEEYSRTDDVLTLKLTVRDTGIGMTQDFVDNKLFTPFVQGENGPRTRFKGTGLGMSIVKKIVDEMHGSITVESEVGVGSTFTVLLPFEIDHSEHKPQPEREEAPADITGARILLVEDNELNMEIAEFMLQDAGAVITKAENGRAAVDTFVENPAGTFDVILMDIMMPVMNGLDAARAIRNMGRADAKTIPIFAMTANAFSEDVEKSIAAGMNEHVAKPLDSKKLVQLIARYLAK